MSALMKTTWSRLEPGQREELEALLRAPGDRYVSEYLDAMAWWLLLMLASVGGLVGLLVEFGPELGETVDLLRAEPSLLPRVLLAPHWLGLLACLVIAPWTAITWARNHQRRGLALTRTAVVAVRGATLKVLPLSDITATSSRVIGARGKRFTVLTLETTRGKVEFNTIGTFAAAVRAAVGR